MKVYAVYILRCSDGTYYTGMTNDIDRRLAEHNEGMSPLAYTFNRRPLKVVFYQDFNDVTIAIDAENKSKSGQLPKREL